MTWFALAFALPFLVVAAALVWAFTRKTPLQRCQSVFRQIHDHAQKVGRPECLARVYHSLPMLTESVRDLDIKYLRIFLNRLKKDYPL